MTAMHPVEVAVRAWRTNQPDAADRLMALEPRDRLLALRTLGYDTPWHLALFNLEPGQ